MPDGTAVAPALAPSIPAHQHYLIDDIMPADSIHLIYGSSGAGTTTWIIQFLRLLAQGLPIFDLPTHPCPFFYVDCARGQNVFRRTLDRLGVNFADIPFISLPSRRERREHRHTLSEVLDIAQSSVPGLRLLILDGINKLLPSGRHNDPAIVSAFMEDLNFECEHRHLTILGNGGTAKSKDGETYADVRARFAGSVEWSKGADLMLHIERTKPAKMDDARRTITVMPLNSATIVTDWIFDTQGRLVNTHEGMGNCILSSWLEAQTPGARFTTGELTDIAQERKVSRATLYRWLSDNLDTAGHGKWIVRPRGIQ